MIDIMPPSEPGLDLGSLDTDAYRARNILSVQLGSLEYAPDLGIDLKYFLSEEFQFQNESFKSYLIQVLANHSINVASLTDAVDNLFRTYNFNITPSKSEGGMVAR